MDYTTRFYLSGFLRIAFYSGFFLVYLQEIGLSKAQIGFLMGLSLILVALLEVPTGVVADRVSKKLSVLLSEGLSVLYVTVLYLASSFPMVLASMIIAALATAFRTGAETAWVYELLSRDGRANDYPRVYGRLRAFELAGGLVGMITGGMLAETFGMRFAVLMSAPFFLLSLVLTATIPADTVKSRTSYMSHIFESIDFVRSSSVVAWLIVYANFIGLSFAAFTSFMQLYFYDVLSSVLGVSMVMALQTVINSASWYIDTGKYRKWIYDKAGAILPILLFFAGLNEWFGFLTMILGTFVFTQSFKEWQGRFQAAIPDEKRATLGSLYSLTAAITSGVLNVLLGLLFNCVGIMMGLITTSLFMLVLGYALQLSFGRKVSKT